MLCYIILHNSLQVVLRIQTFLVGSRSSSGSGRLGPDPDPDPDPSINKISPFLVCAKAINTLSISFV
jgi:hypothetical protein